MKRNHLTESLETVTVDCLLLYLMPFISVHDMQENSVPCISSGLALPSCAQHSGEQRPIDHTPTPPQTHPYVPHARGKCWPILFLQVVEEEGTGPCSADHTARSDIDVLPSNVHIEQLLSLSCDSLSDLLFSTSISLAAPALPSQP